MSCTHTYIHDVYTYIHTCHVCTHVCMSCVHTFMILKENKTKILSDFRFGLIVDLAKKCPKFFVFFGLNVSSKPSLSIKFVFGTFEFSQKQQIWQIWGKLPHFITPKIMQNKSKLTKQPVHTILYSLRFPLRFPI